MTRVRVELELPDEVAAEARAAGLLEPPAIASWVSRELTLRRFDEHTQRLRAVGGTPMTDAEIQAEISAYRREKRGLPTY